MTIKEQNNQETEQRFGLHYYVQHLFPRAPELGAAALSVIDTALQDLNPEEQKATRDALAEALANNISIRLTPGEFKKATHDFWPLFRKELEQKGVIIPPDPEQNIIEKGTALIAMQQGESKEEDSKIPGFLTKATQALTIHLMPASLETNTPEGLIVSMRGDWRQTPLTSSGTKAIIEPAPTARLVASAALAAILGYISITTSARGAAGGLEANNLTIAAAAAISLYQYVMTHTIMSWVTERQERISKGIHPRVLGKMGDTTITSESIATMYNLTLALILGLSYVYDLSTTWIGLPSMNVVNPVMKAILTFMASFGFEASVNVAVDALGELVENVSVQNEER